VVDAEAVVLAPEAEAFEPAVEPAVEPVLQPEPVAEDLLVAQEAEAQDVAPPDAWQATVPPAPAAVDEWQATVPPAAAAADDWRVSVPPEPAPGNGWQATVPPAPAADDALPVLPEPEPVYQESAPEPIQTAAEAPAQPQPSPEPEPEPAEVAAAAPPAPVPPVPDPVAQTLIAWPHGAPAEAPSNGGSPGQSEFAEEATSIIPAWQPSDVTDSKQTVSLRAVPPEVIAAGGGYPAKLTFESGPFAGRIIALPNQMVSVGRAPDNDVVVGDPATSGRHGRIEVRAGAFWISDLGSTNGTLVNGEPVIEKQLSHGDLIAIGQNLIRFTLES
jgi:hypothetical protein